jgi:tryptophan synthase alpha subunit
MGAETAVGTGVTGTAEMIDIMKTATGTVMGTAGVTVTMTEARETTATTATGTATTRISCNSLHC